MSPAAHWVLGAEHQIINFLYTYMHIYEVLFSLHAFETKLRHVCVAQTIAEEKLKTRF